MGENVLPYFEPVYPAVTFRCQLCGETISDENFVTHTARRQRATAQHGDYVFCLGCSPHLTAITQRLSAEGAALDAQHEKAKADLLRELAKRLLQDLRARYARGSAEPLPHRADGETSPPVPTARRRIPGVSIPVPK